MSHPDAGRWSAAPILSWLLHRGRLLPSPEALLDALCHRVAEAGMPLDRVAVFVWMLHPQYMGMSITWDTSGVQVRHAAHGLEQTDLFRQSPVGRIRAGERVVRRRIRDLTPPREFPVLDDLAAEGFTDYVAVEMKFNGGGRNCVTLATRHADGFSDHDIAEAESLLHAFALVIENHVNMRLARTLLDTYLGAQSGGRVLEGRVKRGDGEVLDAVVWFSDLRNSTPLAESLGFGRFLELLNDYFEATAGAVIDHGGEVLRFIGDASLAVFPVAGPAPSVPVLCERAIGAAREAMRRAEAANARRLGAGLPAFEYGIGLHRGEVLYGNIGTPARLEFSVIGAAANEAARVEALTKTAGERLVVSADVAMHAAGPWRSLGRHALRGVGRTVEVYAPVVVPA